jgi:hypothetical protein
MFTKKLLSCFGGIVGLALVLISCGTRAVSAQDMRVSLAGTTVTSKDADRGTSWPAAKSEVGICSILRISAGTYGMEVEPNGFETSV